MALRVIDDVKLNDIAVAIQQKSGNYDPMTVDEMPERVPDGSFDMSVKPNQIKMMIFLTDEDEEERSCAVSFVQTVPHGVEIDWGDGSKEISDDSITKDALKATRYNHIYHKGGFYVIKLSCLNGNLSFYENVPTSGTIMLNCGGNFSHNVYDIYNKGIYNRRLIELSVGDNIILTNSALRNLPYLKKVNRITTTPTSNKLTIAISTGLNIIDIPEGITSIEGYSFTAAGLSGYVKEFVIPSTITEIQSFAFNGQLYVVKYDFTKIQLNENGELPFSIQNNSFPSSKQLTNGTKIVFANSEIAEVAKSTTNLSQYADSITYEGAE